MQLPAHCAMTTICTMRARQHPHQRMLANITATLGLLVLLCALHAHSICTQHARAMRLVHATTRHTAMHTPPTHGAEVQEPHTSMAHHG